MLIEQKRCWWEGEQILSWMRVILQYSSRWVCGLCCHQVFWNDNSRWNSFQKCHRSRGLFPVWECRRNGRQVCTSTCSAWRIAVRRCNTESGWPVSAKVQMQVSNMQVCNKYISRKRGVITVNSMFIGAEFKNKVQTGAHQIQERRIAYSTTHTTSLRQDFF